MNFERKLILRTLEIARLYGHVHLPGALSALQIMAPLFEHVFNREHDVFILSKGHAACAYYACLEALGFKPVLGRVHPERDPLAGIPCTAGSLGHGLPMAVGVAHALQVRNALGRVFVLVGDGECSEGTTWEALCLARQLALTNLTVLVDGNRCGSLGDLPRQDAPQLRILFPALVDYRVTEKGWGVPALKGTKEHKRVLTDEEYRNTVNFFEKEEGLEGI